ncbi:hypothetical protein K505DRAFT_329415 [Melanomma pulvis-pyrius CBS 109.77]|uniref:Genetic interactor of prohibitins 3, mitochondrial n=1 Tax=Melanomma pulvis-pyrius CBS 109.77 TaxID=1314802 RepID=A0A6A6WUM0_9PLEO|nr:hypothetical protein K505DRAFT_329415 [Melanomma pulvis-pyrius CBS 109.77]
MRTALRHARRLATDESSAFHTSIPSFLCPALLSAPLLSPVLYTQSTPSPKRFSTLQPSRQQNISTSNAPATQTYQSHYASEKTSPAPPSHSTLPRACPGCGAPTQLLDRDDAGYYDMERRAVQAFLDYDPSKQREAKKEGDVYTRALKSMDPKLLEQLGVNKEVLDITADKAAPETPVCDRCHNLVHHHTATPIDHPSVAAIQETIAESPHKRNHIYHVIDAADFPLSLIPNLQSTLRLPKLRTQNRRAKHSGWVGNNRIAEVSFIITRADLLAPLKEQVDRLMPYMQDVLRDALGRVNSKARLGNVRLVSAKRGWWTKQVKEEIWGRGGAGWMVGKVNVGKSNLFEVVFPKGRGAEFQDIRRIRSAAEKDAMLSNAKSMEELLQVQQQLAYEDAAAERRRNQPQNQNHLHQAPEVEQLKEEDDYDEDSLLPPPQPYTPYPVLPIASSLPGTTASPIRIPFGRNRGELVDLPGLARTSPGLESFVLPSEQDQLVMKHRIAAERFVLTRGRSLILGGGLIRITPVNADLVFLVHPFVPLAPHITSTEKAIGLQSQTRDLHIPSILTPAAGPQLKSAGRFPLKWDVTKKLAGPLTSPIAGKMKPENLPFRIWSTDILIEGVGWIEVSAQVRRPRGWRARGLVKKDPNHARNERRRALETRDQERAQKFENPNTDLLGRADAFDEAGMGETRDDDDDGYRNDGDDMGDGEAYPEIEVFSPLGKFVGARMPMCGSVLGGPKPISTRERKARPRRSMVSVKRQRKPAERARAG